MDPSEIPEEIWLKILRSCDVIDILAIGCTCWYLYNITDSPYLWKLIWENLKSKYTTNVINLTQMQTLNINYKKMCYRLHRIMSQEFVDTPNCGNFKGYHIPPINTSESGDPSQVVVDIGNKFTWIGSTKHHVTKHLTVFGIPKLRGTSENCDKNVLKKICPTNISQKEPCSSTNIGRMYGSLHKPFCVVCRHKKALKYKHVACDKDSQISLEYSNLKNGLCTEVTNLLDVVNTHIVSPAAALLLNSNFPLVGEYLSHLFHEMELMALLQDPHTTLIFYEPLSMSRTMKQKLVQYLFETVKASRVCLMPKPLAVSSMMSLRTGIVIDTGAFDTYVSVVVDGQVVEGRWRHVPVAGWHIAENLEHAVRFQSHIPLLKLDSLPVKLKCRLSYDFTHEEQRKNPAHRENINIYFGRHMPTVVVSLGEELYCAPEVMYATLNLPQLIIDITEGLPHDTLLECVSHILVTGGTAQLAGFKARLARDLRNALPELKDVVNVKSCSTSTSYGTLRSATVWDDSSEAVLQRSYGTPLYISQVQYVMYGCPALDIDQQS